jgi:hypothetical protein
MELIEMRATCRQLSRPTSVQAVTLCALSEVNLSSRHLKKTNILGKHSGILLGLNSCGLVVTPQHKPLPDRRSFTSRQRDSSVMSKSSKRCHIVLGLWVLYDAEC